jgi:hypothetical protein
MAMNKPFLLKSVLLIFASLINNPAYATTKIAILNFELNDLTSLPNTPEEQKRTASIKPLLEEALRQKGDYEIVQVSANSYSTANAGLGYLFRFDELAAQLGKHVGADWIIVGQHSKPSFLFSYFLAHLIQVKSVRKIANYTIELKGNHEKVTQRGVFHLAEEIKSTLATH